MADITTSQPSRFQNNGVVFGLCYWWSLRSPPFKIVHQCNWLVGKISEGRLPWAQLASPGQVHYEKSSWIGRSLALEALETCGSSSFKRAFLHLSSSTTRGIFTDFPLETTVLKRFKILGMHLGDSWWSATLYDSCHFLSGDAIIVQTVSVHMDTHGCTWYLCVLAGYCRALPRVSHGPPLWVQVLWNSLPVTPRVWDPRIPWQFRPCFGQVRQFGFVTMCKLSMRTIEPPFFGSRSMLFKIRQDPLCKSRTLPYTNY